jgi:hypothetical protein
MTISISEMKANTLQWLKKKYANATTPGVVNDATIEQKGFLLARHAAMLRSCCQKNGFLVSFRCAGADSLTRIAAGNPCKGHSILSKSIKMKDGLWTYSLPSAPHTDPLASYKGLVGYAAPSDKQMPPTLLGLYGYDEKTRKPSQIPLKDIQTNQTQYYTGDYDMHDLLKKTGSVQTEPWGRILAGTVDEKSAVETLNRAMLGCVQDQNRQQAVDAYLRQNKNNRNYESRYALIRHGAQTNYMSMLLSSAGEEDLRKARNDILARRTLPTPGVTDIDKNIVLFDENGLAYIFDQIGTIYAYYAKMGLLNQIPFYYFFSDLKQDYPVVADYIRQIDMLLETWDKQAVIDATEA